MILVPYEQISRYVPVKARVLDIGCGYGILATFLALDAPKRVVLGIDPNQDRVTAVSRFLNPKPNNVSFKTIEVNDLKGPNFDCIVMEEVLHHIPKNEQQDVLKSISSLLIEGGLFIIRENNKRLSFRYLFINLPLEYLLYPMDEKANFRSNRELITMLDKAGLSAEVIPVPWHSLVDVSLFVCRR